MVVKELTISDFQLLRVREIETISGMLELAKSAIRTRSLGKIISKETLELLKSRYLSLSKKAW